jgi:hypothetical protein
MTVAGAIWMPGLGAALGSVGFGAIIAFSSLLSAERGWSPLWLIFSAFAATLVAARLILGHLPDRLGGAAPLWPVDRGDLRGPMRPGTADLF